MKDPRSIIGRTFIHNQDFDVYLNPDGTTQSLPHNPVLPSIDPDKPVTLADIKNAIADSLIEVNSFSCCGITHKVIQRPDGSKFEIAYSDCHPPKIKADPSASFAIDLETGEPVESPSPQDILKDIENMTAFKQAINRSDREVRTSGYMRKIDSDIQRLGDELKADSAQPGENQTEDEG